MAWCLDGEHPAHNEDGRSVFHMKGMYMQQLFNKKIWFLAVPLAMFMAGCSGSNNNGAGSSGGGGGAHSDTTAPSVSFTNPLDTATGVATNRKITAIFSEAMAPASCTPTTFTVSAVPGTVTCVGRTAIFAPTGTLAATTIYTATITTGVTDLAGNALVANRVWTFTTGTTADAIAPTVSSTNPADTASGVAINGNTTATFSEAMDPATIIGTTFTMTGPGLTPVSGTVTSSGSVATFTPANTLAATTLYTATITTGVTDLAGNVLVANKVWTFTTGTTAAVNPAAVNLGTAANYAILAKAGVATVPSSVVTGNVGVSPIARGGLTGWSLITEPTDTFFTSAQVVAPGKLFAADNVGGTTASDLTTAVLNGEAAYTDAAGRSATSAATTNVGAGTLTDLTLVAGVYEWGSAVTIPTDLTLSGSATDVWIFKVGGTLDMAAAKNVILSGSAQSKNIFWQVSGATTIGANTHFEGIILDATGITFGNLASINGRLVAGTAVNLDATTVTQPAP